MTASKTSLKVLDIMDYFTPFLLQATFCDWSAQATRENATGALTPLESSRDLKKHDLCAHAARTLTRLKRLRDWSAHTARALSQLERSRGLSAQVTGALTRLEHSRGWSAHLTKIYFSTEAVDRSCFGLSDLKSLNRWPIQKLKISSQIFLQKMKGYYGTFHI